tara:strand:+ start:1767 stop:3272 length:1506 start_codon:yes stop_codon:yes gene_type:complete
VILAVKSDKNRQLDVAENEWAIFASGLAYKRIIHFHSSMHGDTERVDTNLDAWDICYGGLNFILDFRYLEDNIRPIAKWLVVKTLSSYSLRASQRVLKLFSLNEWTLKDLMLPELYRKLEFCRNSSNGYYPTAFPIIKRMIDFLISAGSPGTEIEDLFELEKQVLGGSNNVLGYYEMEVRLSPLEDQFIRTHSAHDAQYVEQLTYTQLRDFIVLRLCYEIGLRPLQLFKLSKDDLKVDAGKYFSLRRPWAKKGRANDGITGTDLLAISPELGRTIQRLIAQQINDSTQLLQDRDGSPFSMARGVWGIRNTLARWGAENPDKTPYDFRHNMAHRLASVNSSASEIAYMLGHTSLDAAKHYIAASPSISLLREKSLGRNNTYGTMVALLTGEIALPEDWQEKGVMGRIGDELVTGIGGCDANECEYVPVYNCYGCQDFHPFEDGHHGDVLTSLQAEASKQIAISDITKQTAMNPAISQFEGMMEQVKAVISRCRSCKGDQCAQ